MSINLLAFKQQDLKSLRKILSIAQKESVGIGQLIDIIDRTIVINNKFTENGPQKCPHCDGGFLMDLASVEGMKRIGCRKCYYSEVVK